jgi:hypothetical protein
MMLLPESVAITRLDAKSIEAAEGGTTSQVYASIFQIITLDEQVCIL